MKMISSPNIPEHIPEHIQMSNRNHLMGTLSLATPIILCEIFQNTLPLIDLAFVGNLGKIELAAAALATAWFNLWNLAMFGFLTAVDTMLAQSSGAGEWKMYGKWTGTSMVVTVGVTFIVGGAIATCGQAMILFGQDEHLASLSGEFSWRLIPGLFPFYLFKILTKYLQTQNILAPSVIIGILANGLNVATNYVMIYTFGMGLNGAPWATTLTRTIELIMIIIYMFWYKNTTLQKSWPSFQWQNMSYKNLDSFLKLSMVGALSLAAEAWSFEITTIFAGLIGTTELDAHAITLSIAGFIFLSFPFAIGISTCIRVGHFIGEGKSQDAKRSFIVSILFAIVVQIMFMIILIPCGPYIGVLFSSDEDVAHMVESLIPVSAIFMIGDAVHANVTGSCRGLGLQKLSFALNVLGFWFLAVPIGAILAFLVNLDVLGLWIGFNIGIYSAAILGTILLVGFVNWGKEVRKSIARISKIQE